ncbi:hypothetical protein LJR225_004525 [Phenylobacterium sp. LjRoot225]|uniref:hypothetical protein n=1 Tax=Phenylobacterium sp. LjRoot225 TaxID=3342285 RepID=UPI003ECE9E40
MTRTIGYRDLLAEPSARTDVEVWAGALIPSHLHLILTPPDPGALRRGPAPAHRQHAG